MATTNMQLLNPLGSNIIQETALSNTPVALAITTKQFYHFELDNTANTVITYYKFYETTNSPTVTSDEPYIIIAVAASTKCYMFVPTGLSVDNGTWVIATPTQANPNGGNVAQDPVANAVNIRVIRGS